MKENHISQKKRSELEHILRANRGVHTDVIAGLSGGKDSLYQLHLLSHELGLRTKAVTWDHYHAYPSAIKSAARAVKDLKNIEWITIGYRYDACSKLINAYFREVKRFCICPHFMMLRALPMAIDEKIPFIAIAYSPDQNARKGTYRFPDPLKRVKNLISYAHAFKNLTAYCLQQHFPEEAGEITAYLFQPLMERLDAAAESGTAPTILQLSQFYPWNLKTMNTLIYEQYGWKKQGQKKLHSNCLFEPIRGYMEYKLGRPFLKDEADFLVQQGEITEEEAKEALNAMNYSSKTPNTLRHFCEYINLPEEEFHTTLEIPMKREAEFLLSDFIRSLFAFQGFQEQGMGKLIN
jgi:hypothetical protein